MQFLFQTSFGWGAPGQAFLLDGFSNPEIGFIWSTHQGSRLRVQVAPGAGPHFLELSVNPFTGPGLTSQLLVVHVNGVRVAEEALEGEGTVSYRLSPEALGDGTLLIEIGHPQAASPADLGVSTDRRVLGFMLRALRVVVAEEPPRADLTVLPPLDVPKRRDLMGQVVTATIGMDPPTLVGCFESLGHNCEFGLFQRQMGVDPLDMLRFAGVTMDQLLDGLRQDFEGFGEEVDVFLHPTDRGQQEFLIKDRRYGISLHSFETSEQTEIERVRHEHGKRMMFLRRLFVDRVRAGTRIYVFQRFGQTTLSQIRPLLMLLQARGPNALLVVDERAPMPPGAVEQLGRGFFHGRISKLAPMGAAGDSDLCGWLSLCARTWQLWQATQR